MEPDQPTGGSELLDPAPIESFALTGDAALEQKGGGMDIHKPKTVHNMREFLSEIGIVVIGVLIALGSEQIVEAWHWSHQLQAEREALNSEAQDFLQTAVMEVREQSCVNRELRDIETVLERHQSGRPLGLIKPIRTPYLATSTRGTWQIALAGQALSHMSLKEKLAYGAAFEIYEDLNRAGDAEAAAWAKLALLNHPRILNDQDWSALHQAYAEALDKTNNSGTLAEFALKNDNLGLRPPAPSADFARILKEECSALIAR